jgi:hypothetical protein
MKSRIVELYQLDRENAQGRDEREEVWKRYALALIEEKAERKIKELPWRRPRDKDALPQRYAPFWAALSIEDLDDLWLALERARQK